MCADLKALKSDKPTPPAENCSGNKHEDSTPSIPSGSEDSTLNSQPLASVSSTLIQANDDSTTSTMANQSPPNNVDLATCTTELSANCTSKSPACNNLSTASSKRIPFSSASPNETGLY